MNCAGGFVNGLLYFVQSIVKKDPGRAKQNSLATAVTNFTKPGAQNKGDLCNLMPKDPFSSKRELRGKFKFREN